MSEPQTQQESVPHPRVRYYFIGFNASIDRNSIAKLLGTIGAILERKPRPQGIIICISSDGGSMESAFYAYEILRALPIGVGTHNIGLVASAANILFMAGNVRFAAPSTSFLFHETRFPIFGPGVINQAEMRLSIESIKGHDIRSANIIAERIGKQPGDVRSWFAEELRSADFAKQQGVVTEICPLAIGENDEFVQVVV